MSKIKAFSLPMMSAVCAVLFVGLAIWVKMATIFSIDLTFSHWLQQSIDPMGLVGQSLKFISSIGFQPYTGWALLISIVVLGILRRFRELILMILAGFSIALAAVTKDIVARVRPSFDLVTVWDYERTYSFPSGHVVFYTVFFGLWTVILEKISMPLVLRRILQVICLLFIILISISRVYLGAHWLSDTVGGYLFGGIFLSLIIWLYQLWPARDQVNER